MLHRLALRVLPSLTIPVTDAEVRKRKRLVMLVPGLVAFVIYRAAKHLLPLSDPAVLLMLSGGISTMTALGAYAIGRNGAWTLSWTTDPGSRVLWLGGWVGCVYGVQLSLLVLALLKFLAGYDFLLHPDGPAMMAIMIACTSVARDAFEIGHLRRLEVMGRPIMTFPDGRPLRALLAHEPTRVLLWCVFGAGIAASMSVAAWAVTGGKTILLQGGLATVAGGTAAVWAYLAGHQQASGVRVSVPTPWVRVLGFWWWPGLAFAATYYLSITGAVVFVFQWPTELASLQLSIAAGVGSLMALYGYYLGARRRHEDSIQQMVPASVLRCPFVMGILNKTTPAKRPASAAEAAFSGTYSNPLNRAQS